ncbi:MAG: cytochrome C [Planctomycetes bacterium]|nr:cytochrome C [Planctomycetota bacterium]
MTTLLRAFVGPRAPRGALRAAPGRFLAPTALLLLAGACLLLSLLLPLWSMKLLAPQYPRGLTVTAYADRLTGDVDEIDGLNHYIGMRPLNDAAQLERAVAAPSIVLMAALCVAAALVHTRWAALLAFPALSFPFVFLADLAYWLRDSGQNLDPTAPLSRSIKPFVPPVLGEGLVGQFKTIAWVESGWLLQLLAAVFIVVGLYLHRRAYKPLVDARPAPEEAHAAA